MGLFSVLFNFVLNWLVSFWFSFAHRVSLLFFVFYGLFWFCLCMFLCFCFFVWFCLYHLSGVLLCCLLVCLLFVLTWFIAITNSLWDLGSLTRDQAWPLEWECWIEGTRLPENSWTQGLLISENSMKASTCIQDHHHPAASNTQCRMPHPNSKQDKNARTIISRQDSHKHNKNHLSYRLAHQRQENLLPPEHSYTFFPRQSLHNPLDQPQPLRVENKSKSNYNTIS